MPLNRAWTASTFRLVGASTQSSRRSTVRGRMTSWYLPRLKVSRMRSATPQMKLTIWLWFMSRPVPGAQLRRDSGTAMRPTPLGRGRVRLLSYTFVVVRTLARDAGARSPG